MFCTYTSSTYATTTHEVSDMNLLLETAQSIRAQRSAPSFRQLRRPTLRQSSASVVSMVSPRASS